MMSKIIEFFKRIFGKSQKKMIDSPSATNQSNIEQEISLTMNIEEIDFENMTVAQYEVLQKHIDARIAEEKKENEKLKAEYRQLLKKGA